MLYFLNKPFTRQNLNFFIGELKCQRCGRCCGGELDQIKDGGVIVKPDEVKSLAGSLGVSPHQFKDKHTFTKEGKRFMTLPCVFLTSDGCSNYRGRPEVCRQFPFNKTYHHEKSGVDYMSVADCPAGRIVGQRLGVKV